MYSNSLPLRLNSPPLRPRRPVRSDSRLEISMQPTTTITSHLPPFLTLSTRRSGLNHAQCFPKRPRCVASFKKGSHRGIGRRLGRVRCMRCRPTTRRRGQGVHSAGIILGRIQCNCEYSQAEVVGSDDGRLFWHHDVNVFEPSR